MVELLIIKDAKEYFDKYFSCAVIDETTGFGTWGADKQYRNLDSLIKLVENIEEMLDVTDEETLYNFLIDNPKIFLYAERINVSKLGKIKEEIYSLNKKDDTRKNTFIQTKELTKKMSECLDNMENIEKIRTKILGDEDESL